MVAGPLRRSAVRDGAVEQQRVARREPVDRRRRDRPRWRRARRRAAPRRRRSRPPRATSGRRPSTRARASPLPSAHSSRTPGASGPLAGADDLGGLRPRQRPQRADRHVERAGDPLDRADARPREPALELAQERMREPGAAAERLQGQAPLVAQLTHTGPEARGRLIHAHLLTVRIAPSYSVLGWHASSTARRCRRTVFRGDWARIRDASCAASGPAPVAGASCAGAPGLYGCLDYEPRWDPPLAGGAGPTSARRRVV